MNSARRAFLACVSAAIMTALAVSGCTAAVEHSGSPADAIPGAPVLNVNFADPDVVQVDGTYFAYATNDNNRNVQVASSANLLDWEVLPDALPKLPSWIIPGKTWAPEVTRLSDDSFVMYFTATNFAPTLQCIGVATASDPAGPFTVQGDAMIICPEDEGGAIDASTVVIDDVLYLVWKNDGNCCELDTWIQAATLSPDGLSVTGDPIMLLMQTEDWEGSLIEAPTVITRGSGLVMLYSANSYGDARYAVGAASAASIDGPWTKEIGPILSTDSSGGLYRGPGGQDLVMDVDGQDYLVFHAWDKDYTYRALHVAEVDWGADIPRIVIPNEAIQR
ncbi:MULTISPECIES: glycoside hydrolase family 43 protein [Cryobacterium]|uniref:Glycosyl hydrolases family 43 n=2 Tax=Cryobacterium levicorallinum TaxID=995038 RepID=A0ABY1EC65_9MICO|nr:MULTISPECIES: glycoside hydrolase family 43 protein [Cryobacterium]GEP26034.1 glycoside hydrolase [Cryobacterium levicorallinum]SFH40480.1 Glycosyl hydrolases family 43 [Cryobacterium levicorallinum]